MRPSTGLDERKWIFPCPRPALTRLFALDPEIARIVELRFFGGLTVEETARVQGASPGKVKKDWRVARAWLGKEMGREPS